MQSVTVSVVTELLEHDLATGIRAWVAVRVGTGRLSLQVRVWCQECGSRDIEIESDGRHC